MGRSHQPHPCQAAACHKPARRQGLCWAHLKRTQRGQDVLGLAQTGSGKTAAFSLPLLQR